MRWKSWYLNLLLVAGLAFLLWRQAEVIPGTNYKILSDLVLQDRETGVIYTFENLEVRTAFVSGIEEDQAVLEKNFETREMGEDLVDKVYGGEEGQMMEWTESKGFGWNWFSSTISYPVPAGKYGIIRLETRYKNETYRLEQEGKLLGTYTVKTPQEEYLVPIYTTS